MSDDANSQNQTDLPSSWPIKTSQTGEGHHEDLPLFPVLKEKPTLESPIIVPQI